MKEKMIKFNYYLVEMENDLLFNRIFHFLDTNMENSAYSINTLLKDVHLSRTQLHRRIKDKVGISTTEFIKIYKLKKSISYLEQGFNSSETAFKIGFESPSYYTKCFKDFFGNPPSYYHKKKNKSFFQAFQDIIKY